MVRVGIIATINTTYEIFIEKYLVWIEVRPSLTLDPVPQGPNHIKQPLISRTEVTIHLYAEDIDIPDLINYLLVRRIIMTNDGLAPPEPTPGPGIIPPDPNQVIADAIIATSFNATMQLQIDNFWDEVEADFVRRGGDIALFRRTNDLKWLRQRKN